MARLLPPEKAPIETVARDVGVGVQTLERWRDEVLNEPARERAWTAAARLEAVIATAAMDEAQCSAWCRANGVFPQTLQQWRDSAMQALADPQQQARASAQQGREERQRIQQLERELNRKDKALAETAALLVLSKKVEAIFNKGGDE